MAHKTYDTPANVVELLDRVVGAAAGTTFYDTKLGGRRSVDSLSSMVLRHCAVGSLSFKGY